MTKVISFKVDDSIYDKLKSMNMTFGEIFRPIIAEIINNQMNNSGILSSIRTKIDLESLSIDEVHNNVDLLISKRFKIYEDL